MSDAAQVRVETSSGVCTLTLDRPAKLNAFTWQMADELIAALDQADADDDVRAVILTGAGRGFCAGADLDAGHAVFDHRETGEIEDNGGRVSLRMYRMLKPVIVAFNGPAVGVGVTMTLPADVRLASTQAKFGFVFSRRGIVLEAASSWFLPRIVGISRALEWSATGRLFDAGEALAAGLVRSVHTPEDLLPAAYRLAQEMSEGTAPVSVALNRQLLWTMAGAPDPFPAHLLDSALMRSRGTSADAAEGVSSFTARRPAAFPLTVSRDLPAEYPWRREPAFSDALPTASGG